MNTAKRVLNKCLGKNGYDTQCECGINFIIPDTAYPSTKNGVTTYHCSKRCAEKYGVGKK